MKRGALGLEIWAGQFLELDGAANSVVGKMHATLPPPPMGMHSAYFPLLQGSALRWPLSVMVHTSMGSGRGKL